MRDWRGVLIDKGTYIVYPARRGSSMWMVEAVVEEVTEVERGTRTVPALQVRPVDATWTRTMAVGMKTQLLTALDRVTVVDPPPLSDTPNGYCVICHGYHDTDCMSELVTEESVEGT